MCVRPRARREVEEAEEEEGEKEEKEEERSNGKFEERTRGRVFHGDILRNILPWLVDVE